MRHDAVGAFAVVAARCPRHGGRCWRVCRCRTRRSCLTGFAARAGPPGNTDAFPTGSGHPVAPSTTPDSCRLPQAILPMRWGHGSAISILMPLTGWSSSRFCTRSSSLSAYFEARRDDYYDRLLAVSRDDDWTGWVEFFLGALKAQAEDNLQKTGGILDLYENMVEMTRSQYAIHALDWIFERPIFSAALPPPPACPDRQFNGFAALRERHRSRDHALQRSAGRCSRVPGPARHRGRAGSILMFANDVQTGLRLAKPG